MVNMVGYIDGIVGIYNTITGGGGSSLPVLETSTTAATTGSTNHVINKPTGTASGDLLLLLVSCDTVGATTLDAATAGFSTYFFEQGGGATSYDILAVYYRIADGTEGSSFTITSSIAEDSAMVLCRISGAHATTPIEGDARSLTVTTDPAAAPTYTTTQDNCLVIRLCNSRLSASTLRIVSTPSTEVARLSSAAGGANNAGTTIGVSQEDKATAGATGTADFDLTAAETARTCTLAIAPA